MTRLELRYRALNLWGLLNILNRLHEERPIEGADRWIKNSAKWIEDAEAAIKAEYVKPVNEAVYEDVFEKCFKDAKAAMVTYLDKAHKDMVLDGTPTADHGALDKTITSDTNKEVAVQMVKNVISKYNLTISDVFPKL